MTKKWSLTKVSKRNLTDEANHFYAMYSGDLRRHAFITEMDGDDDDTSSIESFSTMATVDNNPGAGRVVDTYFFQPAGRQIEKLALRLTIRHLHPWRITATIDRIFGGYSSWLEPKSTLDNALLEIGIRHDGSTIVSGLKGLVRQAQWVKVT